MISKVNNSLISSDIQAISSCPQLAQNVFLQLICLNKDPNEMYTLSAFHWFLSRVF